MPEFDPCIVEGEWFVQDTETHQTAHISGIDAANARWRFCENHGLVYNEVLTRITVSNIHPTLRVSDFKRMQTPRAQKKLKKYL